MLQNLKFFLAASEYLEIEKGGCCVQRTTKHCGSQQSFNTIDLCIFFFRMRRTNGNQQMSTSKWHRYHLLKKLTPILPSFTFISNDGNRRHAARRLNA